MDDGEARFASSPPSQPHIPTPEDDPSVHLHYEDDVDDEDLDEESRRLHRRAVKFKAAWARANKAKKPIVPGTMNDGRVRCPVFCIADIPTTFISDKCYLFSSILALQTLDLFLECVEEYVTGQINDQNYIAHVSDWVVIMDTKDIDSITKGSSPPIDSCPTAFLGHSLMEVRDWFDANIAQRFPDGFLPHCFLVMDDESTEDDSCIFVCTQDSAPGEIQSLRCDFQVALVNAVDCQYKGVSIEEGPMGNFMRSGVTMTKENLKLVEDGGLYFEGGEVKLDQYWRDFRNW